MLAKGNESRFQNWQLQDAMLFYTFTQTISNAT